MKIFFLMLPAYDKNNNHVKKVENAPTVFFNGVDPEVTIDIYYVRNFQGKIADQERYILEEAKTHRPDLILLQATWPVSDFFFVELHSLGIPIVLVYADTLIAPHAPEMDMARKSDYVIIYDSLTNYLRYRLLFETTKPADCSGVIFGAGNQFPANIYRNLNLPKEYDVSLIGSLEGIRKPMSEFLAKELTAHGKSFFCGGGTINFDNKKPAYSLSDLYLPHDKYLETISKSKINLIPQTRPERCQIKCKVFEYMACGAFCLLDQNIEYELMLPKGTVAYYTSFEDCVEKILYYLKHEDQRIAMANKGFEWYNENFNFKKFWKECFYAIKNRSPSLPVLPKVEEIYNDVRKKISNEVIYAEIKNLIFKAIPHENKHTHPPIHTMTSSATFPSKYLTDPLSTRFWHSEFGWPQSVTFDYGESMQFDIVHINNVMFNDGIYLKDFNIQASNNLVEWHTLFTGKQKNLEILQIFSFPNQKPFRFYRLNGFSNYHINRTMILANLEFFQSESAKRKDIARQNSRLAKAFRKAMILQFRINNKIYRISQRLSQKLMTNKSS